MDRGGRERVYWNILKISFLNGKLKKIGVDLFWEGGCILHQNSFKPFLEKYIVLFRNQYNHRKDRNGFGYSSY